MFTAALFTIAKMLKQPRYLSTDEQMKKIWNTYTMEYYSATKKELQFAICKKHGWTWRVLCHLHVESKKYNKLMNLTKKKQTHKYREQTSGYQRGERRGKGQYKAKGLRSTNYYV